MSYASLQHSEHKHELFLVDEGRIFRCWGCHEIGFGYHYKCTDPDSYCEFRLHIACAEAPGKPPIKLTELYGDRDEFKFCTEPVNRHRYCVACGKRIRRYSYRCSEKNLELHPSCTADFPLETAVNGIPVRLEKNLKGRNCLDCQSRKYGGRDLDTWAYISKCREKQYLAGCLLDSLIMEYRKRSRVSRDGSSNGSQVGHNSSRNSQNGSTGGGSQANRNQSSGFRGLLKFTVSLANNINQAVTFVQGYPFSSS